MSQSTLYQFRGRQSERFYLAMSSVKGKAAPNAAVLAAPLVSVSDKRLPNDGGSVVLVRALQAPIDDRRGTGYCSIEHDARSVCRVHAHAHGAGQ